MLGSSSILALWLLAADPSGLAAASDCPDDGPATTVAFQAAEPLEEKADDGKAAPRPSSRRAAYYEDRHLPSVSGQDGIPGLPPLPDDTPAPVTKQAPAAEPSQKPTPPRLLGDMGQAACGDQCPPNPCVEVYTRPRRSGGLRNWLSDVAFESWIDQGFTINTLSPRDRSNGPVTFNNRSNDYQLNQTYLRLKRDVDRECDVWALGGRIDALYGTDSHYVTSRGLETFDDFTPKWNAQQYGLALPQCYAELVVPWGNGVGVKMGHYYSGFGYESVTAPDNFFYSHSYAFQYGTPFTFTGFVATTKFGHLTLEGGMNRGWNNWEADNGALTFTGALSWESDSKLTKITLSVVSGDEQPDPSTSVCTLYSLVVQQKIGGCWEYVLEHDYATEPRGGLGETTAAWYGIAQYFYYTINDRWKAGMRFEWFHDQNRAPDLALGGLPQGDYCELTAGLNWKPNDRIAVRPELRWDWTSTPDLYPFGDGTRSNQLLLDCDVIVRF
jgi:hypothetical protein